MVVNPGRRDRLWRGFVIATPYLWLLFFFLIPFAIVLKISFADPLVAQPPFSDFFDWSGGATDRVLATFDNYRFLLEDKLYLVSYLKSIKIALIATLLCLLLGFPMAYAIALTPYPWRNLLLLLVILPFWTSFLLRVYAWMVMLGKQGLINHLLMSLGLIDEPLQMLYTDGAVYLGIVYTYVPFMILPLYATLEKLDLDLHEAAADLGARPRQVFRDITLPLALPGIIAGCLLVFIPALGEYVIPALLGGLDSLMIGRTLYDEFFVNRDWPLASAVAVVLLLILVLPIMLFQRLQQEPDT
ncbi:MAG: ABC transporter permease subunit [Halioglobus sp.]|nr:ABC transporter permease subunit [Halioglobus sp.]MCB1709825.1 ABC transporter permease subunit [Halioglobus sp.]MCP5121918.1 ABC transporter permease subunit [Pseudomonadales bacterium]MCP5192543.1 ABC transporter permease subunit [Pseudomonadales bacterium]